MVIPARLDLTVREGATFNPSILIKGVDLTGQTVRFYAFERGDTSSTMDDNTAGNLSIVVSSEGTTVIPNFSDTTTLAYDFDTLWYFISGDDGTDVNYYVEGILTLIDSQAS